jgi:polysaccharide pyruvyl transferase WcaK-like protein
MKYKLAGLALRALRTVLKTHNDRVVVLPPAVAGSLGDQAMMDSVTHTLIHEHGKTPVLICRRSDKQTLRNPVERAYLDAAGLTGKLKALLQIFRSRSLLFVGADVIDGIYDKQGGDCTRLKLLDLATRAGMQTAAINFSFSEAPRAAAVNRLRALQNVPMHPRDAVSLQRFREAVGRDATQVADVAFLLTPEARAENAKAAIAWATKQKEKNHVVLGFNAGGPPLSKKKGNKLDILEKTLNAWLKASPKRSILLLPHDYKPPPAGDVEPLQVLKARLEPKFGDRVHMVEFPFDTWDVKAIAASLDFTLLTRMHFAIACLGQTVPPLCMAYAGKFEGLMQYFHLENMLVDDDESQDSKVLLAKLEEFETRLPDMKARIAENLPAVRTLSRKNFSWLE